MTTIARKLLLCAMAAWPLAAVAQQARTAKPVNLRAGPARDYPLVAAYGPGAPISVQGCTPGYGWCDVIGPDGARGWIYAANIVYPYQSQEVPVMGYGAAIGLPIVTFALGAYWGSYYRDRPWYGNRGHWDHRPVYRTPPPAYRPPPPHFVAPPRPVMRPPGGPHFGGGGPGRPPGGFDHHGGGRPGGFPGGGHGGPGGPGGGHGGPGGGHGGGHGGGGGGHHR